MYNAYKDKFGLLYIHIRLLDNNDCVRVIIKAGRTDNLEHRIGQYSRCGLGILWISCYPTEYAKVTGKFGLALRINCVTVEQNSSSTCNSRSWAPIFSLFFARAKRHTMSILVTRWWANSRVQSGLSRRHCVRSGKRLIGSS
jgi:hypothetical protein